MVRHGHKVVNSECCSYEDLCHESEMADRPTRRTRRLNDVEQSYAAGLAVRVQMAVDTRWPPQSRRRGSSGVLLLAEATGISQSQISRLMAGRTFDPPIYTMLAIARATGTSIDWLATGKGPREHASDEDVLRRIKDLLKK